MDFKPILRFAVMTDLHYSDKHLHVRDRFKSAAKSVYNYCVGEEYTALDALYIIGDFTDRGKKIDMQRLADDCDAYIKPETKIVITLANHELHYMDNYKDAISDFKEVFGMECDRHEIINGYHFISLSSTIDQGPWHDSFDKAKRDYLKAELEKARKDTGNKPIFVFQHAGIPGTITGGLYGTPDLYSVLSQYPQVIDFSGHSHRAVNNPKEIFQGDFTAVSCGSLLDIAVSAYYDDPGIACESTTDPNAAHMLVVEADCGGRVRIRRLDVIAKDFFENDSYIENLIDRGARIYTPQRVKTAPAPYFEKDASLTAEYKNGRLLLHFPAAKCKGERVAEYNIIAYDRDGTAVAQKNISSLYYRLNQPDEYTAEIETNDTAEKLRVYATGFWANTSSPLCGNIKK